MQSKAHLLLRDRVALHATAFAELVIWHLDQPLAGSGHTFKYRFAFVVDNACVLRYDNEAGKGDHKHVGGQEHPYVFVSLDQLIDDFWQDVDRLLDEE